MMTDYSDLLSPEGRERRDRMLTLGEQAMVAEDVVLIAADAHRLTSQDAQTGIDFARQRVFARQSSWIEQRLTDYLNELSAAA